MRALLLLPFLLATAAVTQQPTPRPNILVLYSDDAGYGDFGFQPDCVAEMKELTPHIDSIAAEGARFANAYMSGCVCSPSRAGLMTGRYQQRFGFENNLPPGTKSGLSRDETFGARRLRELGYRTGLVGKWHLGYPPAFHPNERGFDWFYGLLQGSRSYLPYDDPTPHRVIQENGAPTEEGGYVTDRLGDAACAFLKKQQRDAPFFLFVSFTAPHSPNQPKQSDLPRVAHIEAGRRRKHCGLLVSLDDNVGRILACLKEQGLADDTLVVFTNDNGGQTQTGANNHPLSGHKGELLEGGIRVPMAMRWPAHITAGSVIDDPVIALDLVPTFLSLAGGPATDEMKLDGIDLLPRVTGAVDALPERALFWRTGGVDGSRAVRRGRFKLLAEPGAAPRLFDLVADVSETADVGAAHPEVRAALTAKLLAWERELVAPLWGPGSKQRGQ